MDMMSSERQRAGMIRKKSEDGLLRRLFSFLCAEFLIIFNKCYVL